MSQLVRQYSDFPLGGVDASIVALAERLGIGTVVTLDDRHFRAVRPRHRKMFHLLRYLGPTSPRSRWKRRISLWSWPRRVEQG